MSTENVNKEDKVEFGPLLSRVYSFFATRTSGHRKIYTKIVEDIVQLNPSSILEIGCGPGIVSAMIAQRLPEVTITCVDPSPTMIDIANRRFEKFSLTDRVRGVVGNSADTSVQGRFDVIFSSISFHHWTDPDTDLANIVSTHLGNVSMIIYEHLIKSPSKEGAHRHGLSVDHVKKMEISGTEKSYEVYNDLIIVTFKKKYRKEK